MLLVMLLTMTAQTAWAEDDVVVYTSYTASSGTSGSNSNEDYDELVDNNKSTKWCVTSLGSPTYIEFQSAKPIIPVGYVMTTGDDTDSQSGRNPKSWKILAKANTGDEWTTLVDVTNNDEMPAAKTTDKEFSIEGNTAAYQYFRFEVSAIKSGDIFQLAEFQFKVYNDNKNLGYSTVSGVDSRYVCKGSPISITPNVTTCDGITSPTFGTDYTVKLNNNDVTEFPFTVNAVGNYTLTITGTGTKGNGYYGSKEFNFRVYDHTDLSTITANYTALDGETLEGTLSAGVKISIAAGATVTLNGVTITNIPNNASYTWAGINCEGNATIILADGTTNTVKGAYRSPGIRVPEGYTLTISGSGRLDASSASDNAAGIGAGLKYDTDNVDFSCGNIVINGGVIYANGGTNAAGIGSGKRSRCGNITINNGVRYIEVTKGSNAPNSIGAGAEGGSCGTVTILGVETGGISNAYTYDSSIKYTVKFDGNGGTGSMSDLTLALGEPKILPANAFSNTNYTFAGWSTTANSDMEYYNGQTVMNLATTNNATVTLYAVWKDPNETITSSTGEIKVYDGQTLTGEGGANTHVTIADGATVTLNGVTITSITNDVNHNWAGITCEGDATIILADGTTNTVKGGYGEYPGVYVPAGKTLTIQGDGSLNASSNGYAAGIGAGYDTDMSCGNIIIEGGNITATGGSRSAGIGSNCGNITISGGSVTATGGSHAAGIGAGKSRKCGDITISGGTINATGGDYGAGIGAGYGDNSNSSKSTCGSITISGGIIIANGGDKAAGIGTGKGYNTVYTTSESGNITITGGTISATKGDSNAEHSIGRGQYGTCGTVTIGGVVGYISESPYRNFTTGDNYTIHFDANGGTGSMSDMTIAIGEPKSLPNCEFTRSGYEFLGWSNTPDGSVKYSNGHTVMNLTETANTTVTLYAVWRGLLNTVTISGPNSYLYTGSPISIEYTVTDVNGNLLTKGTHYSETIKKDDNIVTSVTDKGTYTLTLTGLGNYRGSKEFTFKVVDSPEGLSYQSGQTGYYYVNMPSGGTKSVTLFNEFTSSIKVYDDGGKSGNYSSVDADSYLILYAPKGYSLKLTGTVSTDRYGTANLSVYDGATTSATLKIDKASSNSVYEDGTAVDIGTVNSSGRCLLLLFKTGKSQYNYAGLDLIVELVDSRQPNTITVNNPTTGGTVTPSVTSAKMGDEITLNISPSENYLLSGLTVNYAEDQTVETSGGEWYLGSNTSTFTMPGSAVTVNPTFTNNLTAEGGLSVKMLKSGELTPTIPAGVTSFKVNYNTSIREYGASTSKLLINAPEGYYIQLTGHAYFSQVNNRNRAAFKVYNGNTTESETLINVLKENDVNAYNSDITPIITTGQSMLISCESQLNQFVSNYDFDWNLDLTATYVKIEPHSISTSSTHGNVSSDKATAEPHEIVTLTVTPDEGYVLQSISVTDGNGTISLTPSATDASFGDANYYAANEFTFKMRSLDATVNATFMPKTDFYVNMPKTGQRELTIPTGTTSFKVYDSGGKNSGYGNGENGDLLLTAPEGYVMNIKGFGTIRYYKAGVNASAILRIFDGNSNSSETIGEYIHTRQYETEVDETSAFSADKTSSGHQVLIHFETPSGDLYSYGNDNFAFTVTLKKLLTNGITVDAIADQTWNDGNAIEPTALVVVKDGETVITDQCDISFSNNTNVGTATVNITAKTTSTGYAGTKNDVTFKIVAKPATIAGVSGGPLSITQDQNGYTAIFDGTSEADLNITATVAVKDVKINREFHSGQASTVMLPFDYTCNNSEGGKFYAFVGVAWNDSENKWEATMKEPGDDTNQVTTLTANTPYLFMPSGTEMTFPNIPNMAGGTVTLKPASEGGNCSGTSGDANWEFHGTYTKKTWTASDPDKDYGFAATSGKATDGTTTITAGQFVRFAPGAWMKPMRCYLSYIGTSAPAPARGVTRAAGDGLPQTITVRLVSRGGETTAIGTLDTQTGELSFDGWYDMNGRKLDGKPTKKGLYINNGHKVVIK